MLGSTDVTNEFWPSGMEIDYVLYPLWYRWSGGVLPGLR